MSHSLDRPVWNALTGPQAHLARGDGWALAFDPDYALFAASRDASLESVAALVGLADHGPLGVVEAGPFSPPPGLKADPHVANQMVAQHLAPARAGLTMIDLSEDDAPDMLALTTLTKPGPFFAKTHRLGGFVGIKEDGRLLAMAGERLKVDGFTEVSGVCTHPDARGRGYARALMLEVAHRIAARGATPFLHVYPWNTGAIELYERLGFRFRAAMNFVVLNR